MTQPTRLDPPGVRGRRWRAWRASRPGGTAATTSSPTSSPWSSRARSTGAPGRSPGRCAGSSTNYKIKTVLALAHPADHPLAVREKAMAERAGLSAGSTSRSSTSGPAATAEAITDQLEKAAAVLADPTNQPVYFHCHHGINRASMVQIAYRTKYCGWTLEQATDEIARTFGLVEVDHGPDYRHMQRFYSERVLPDRRPAPGDGPAHGRPAAGLGSPADSEPTRPRLEPVRPPASVLIPAGADLTMFRPPGRARKVRAPSRVKARTPGVAPGVWGFLD